MEKKGENIVLFPKLKTILKQESMDAINERRYEEAIEKIDLLLHHGIESHDILVGKLICLMELGYYDDAEQLCEQLINDKDEHYYEYLQIYTNLLFQSGQYGLLVDRIQQLFENEQVPTIHYNQLNQLYEISVKLLEDKRDEDKKAYIKQLKKAVDSNDDAFQWRIVEKWKEMKLEPYFYDFQQLLKNKTINPLVKTAIIQRMQEQNVQQPIIIEKFDKTIEVIPANLPKLYQDSFTLEVESLLEDIEQDNPSLFELLQSLFYRFIYVQHPLIPNNEDQVTVSIALKIIGYQLLGLDQQIQLDIQDEQAVENYTLKIIECERLYLSIIDA